MFFTIFVMNFGGVGMRFDDKDKVILELLRQDSRIANTAIAGRAGLTEGAVRNRIARLVREGVIRRFTVDLAGGSNFGVVMLKARGDTKRMMQQIARLGVAKDAYEISGEYDGCVILEGASLQEIDGRID